jgi:hypothetical protein
MAETYELEGYDSDEERKNDPGGLPLPNLFAAATYMKWLLTTNEIEYAAIGGFAMLCRASQRNTRDVDLVVNAPEARLWQVLKPQKR